MRFSEKYKLFHHIFWLWGYEQGNKRMGWVHHYQDMARIYLDEYEVAEVDLRVNFDTSLLMKRFLNKG